MIDATWGLQPGRLIAGVAASRSARLLSNLARTGDPITHDLLDGLPQDQSLRYVREVLGQLGCPADPQRCPLRCWPA